MKNIRVHTSNRMHARLFIQFLALILISEIKNIAKENKNSKNLTISEYLIIYQL
jgi:transposase